MLQFVILRWKPRLRSNKMNCGKCAVFRWFFVSIPKLTDSIDLSRRKISSCSKCNVPVLPRWRANAAAQAEWMLFTQFSSSTWHGACTNKERRHFLIIIFANKTFYTRFWLFISVQPRDTGRLFLQVSKAVIRKIFRAVDQTNSQLSLKKKKKLETVMWQKFADWICWNLIRQTGFVSINTPIIRSVKLLLEWNHHLK